MKPLIICGGIGTKLWPLSRKESPKHFLPIFNGQSLFQLNWNALRKAFAPNEIYLQTNAFQASLALSQVPEIKQDNIFIEPEMRNQGPATGFCAAKLFKRFPDEPFILVQADVLRSPDDAFISFIQWVEGLVQKNKTIVSGIVRPKQSIEGIDFIIPGEKVEQNGTMSAYRLGKWVMRNDPIRSEYERSAETVFGHANHYAWTPRLLLEAYQKHAPEWYNPLMNMIEAFGTPLEAVTTREEYAKMPADPIEARVTNHVMKAGLLVACPFDWWDLGTWDSIEDYFLENSIIQNDRVVSIEAENNFVFSDKPVVLVGVNDLHIIDTKDALLVSKKNYSHRMCDVIAILKNKQPEVL